MSKTPEPGIYYDVPFEDYLRWDAVSNSRLKLVRKSLAHYRRGFVEKESDALLFGSLVHAGRLEPASVQQRYAVMPDFKTDPSNVGKDGKRSYHKTTWVKEQEEAWREANQGKEAVSVKHYQDMLGMLAALTDNKRAMGVLGGAGQNEVSLLWSDPETNLLCKARFDRLKQKQGVFADLKTTRDAQNFEKHLVDFGYHRQMAFYQKGWEVLSGGEWLEPWIIAMEKDDPWGTRAAPMCDEVLEEGWPEVQEDLHSVAIANLTQSWPGYENPEHWDGDEYHLRRRERIKNAEPLDLTIGNKEVTV